MEIVSWCLSVRAEGSYENISHIIKYAGRDSNGIPPEQESRALPLCEPVPCEIIFLYISLDTYHLQKYLERLLC